MFVYKESCKIEQRDLQVKCKKQVQCYKFEIAKMGNNNNNKTIVCLIDKFIKYDYKQNIILLLTFYRNMTRIRECMRIDGYNIGEFSVWFFLSSVGWKVINVHKSNKQYNFRMKIHKLYTKILRFYLVLNIFPVFFLVLIGWNNKHIFFMTI